MSRRYHSASSDALGRRCKRAWWYAYCVGLREPDVSWNDILAGKPHTSRQRSTALGKAVHATFESWYRAEPSVNWHGLVGQVALSGLHHLPHRDRVHRIFVEAPIGDTPIPPADADVSQNAVADGPKVAMQWEGILWAGYRDLVVSAPGEFLRLGIAAPDGWALLDHKTSADIDRYALTPQALKTDFQANLYGLSTMMEHGAPGAPLSELPARWVYYATRATRKARPVDATLYYDIAAGLVTAASARARELDTIRDERDAVCNPAACGEYGGCQYHISAGGPCDARRSIGALIQARVKKEGTNMAMTEEAKARFAGLGKGVTAPPPVSAPASDAAANTDASAEARVHPETSAVPEVAPPPPAAKRTRKAKAAEAPASEDPRCAQGGGGVTEGDGGPQRDFVVPGAYGPVRISGASADVLDAAQTLLGGGS